jgi:ATP synthase F1 delta subunit
MNTVYNRLAISYAHAFLDCFGDTITPQSLPALQQAVVMFKQHQRQLALALAPYLDAATVTPSLTKACITAGAPTSCAHLIELLAAHNRLELLPAVLAQISEQYKLRHHIVDCAVSSSHELGEQERTTISKFLEKKTQHTVMPQYVVNKKLIAGIRIAGDTLFWEYSVRRYLEKIYCKLIR